MDMVQVQCPSCWTSVELPMSALTISALPIDGMPGRVAFACPACHGMRSLDVGDEVVRTLRSRGCGLARGIASRSRHPAGRRMAAAQAAPPLTQADLVSFRELLERDDWFDQLRAIAD
jgi:hypothetical protein